MGKQFKTRFLILTVLGLLSLISIQAETFKHNDISNRIEESDNAPDRTEIELQGNLLYNHGPNSVKAFVCTDYVQICFHRNLGYVNITLMNEAGSIVYNNTLNIAVQKTLHITLSDSSGNYTLILDNANGYAEGDFAR